MSTLTVDESELVWERWRAGEPSRVIARRLRCSPARVRRHLALSGGIRPVTRRRSSLRLSLLEREEISRGIAAGHSARVIGQVLGRSASTVSREIARNGGRDSYRAAGADARAWERAKRPRPSKLERSEELRGLVQPKLNADWSPQQIAAWLKGTFPDEPDRQLSHEVIYRTLYTSTRLELPAVLLKHLRSGRLVRHPRVASKSKQGRGRLRNMTSIHSRPATVETREEIGHWEGDLVMGRRPSAVATLVERSTRMLRLVRLPGIKGPDVRAALTQNMRSLPPGVPKSLTWDRGREMSEHALLAEQLGIDVYFCDPRSPWQRGSNENTNRLLRQYLPKQADLARFTQTDLDRIAEKINTRPRRVLSWDTSHERLLDSLMT